MNDTLVPAILPVNLAKARLYVVEWSSQRSNHAHLIR